MVERLSSGLLDGGDDDVVERGREEGGWMERRRDGRAFHAMIGYCLRRAS